MKKGMIFLFFCLGVSIIADDTVDTTDIRKYHQQLEEKIFELEKNERKEEKIEETFLLGKRRISDAIKNEKVILESKGLFTSEKLVELKNLEEKYEEILAEYRELLQEKEKLKLENNMYLEKIKKQEGEK